MKALIKNEFIYYQKNTSKLVLSLLYIVSLFIMLNVYDNLELSEIKKQVKPLQNDRLQLSFYPKFDDYEILNNYYNFIDGNYTDVSEEEKEIFLKIEDFYQTSIGLSHHLNDFATLHAGGRMNLELTPYRHYIYTNLIKYYEIAEYFGDVKDYYLNRYSDVDLLKVKVKQLNKLMESETVDDFNYFTTTFANYPSKVFEGYMLFIILLIVLLLFYDIISKDFENLTYKTIYTNPYPRNKVIKAKLLFAILYTFILTILGIFIVSFYLLFSKRIGYMVLNHRQGYLLHPQIININILSIFNFRPHYILIPQYLKNILSLIIGISLIMFWILLVIYFSNKFKASNLILTILSFLLIFVFFVTNFNFSIYFAYLFPVFSYNFENIINGISSINIFYLLILTNVYNIILYKLVTSDISKIDLLDGDDSA